MRRLLIVAAVLVLLPTLGAAPQVPEDYLQHPAVKENLNLRTRVVHLEMALFEVQNQLALQQQRIVDLEAAVAALDPATVDVRLVQLETQQQVLLTEVKVVETVSQD